MPFSYTRQDIYWNLSMEICFNYEKVQEMLLAPNAEASVLSYPASEEKIVSGVVGDIIKQALRCNAVALGSIARCKRTVVLDEPASGSTISGHVLLGFDVQAPNIALTTRQRTRGGKTASWRFSSVTGEEAAVITAALRRKIPWQAWKYGLVEFTVQLPDCSRLRERTEEIKRLQALAKDASKPRQRNFLGASSSAKEVLESARNCLLQAEVKQLTQQVAQLKEELASAQRELESLKKPRRSSRRAEVASA
jgi:hypothetical protein